MNRTEAERYIAEKYGVSPEYPWVASPNHAVFRHKSSRKWFALIMNISGSKLGVNSDEVLDIMNVKCNGLIIGSLLGTEGFFPAYHMNKNNWISIALDGSAADDMIRWLIDMSFEATASKKQNRKRKSETRIDRIIRMEQYYDTLCCAVRKNADAVRKDSGLQTMLRELTEYYENGQWLADYEADERGELPSELKRGVLSQDGVYDLLSEIEEN